MSTITIISAIIIAVLAVIYVCLSNAINKTAIVRINQAVHVFKKKPSVLPTLVGLAIIAVILIVLYNASCFGCISYSK